MSGYHPPQCWREPGHEACAAAILTAMQHYPTIVVVDRSELGEITDNRVGLLPGGNHDLELDDFAQRLATDLILPDPEDTS